MLVALTRPSSVADFEQQFARLMEQEHAIAFPYGRTGQLLLLEAMGLKGREIICPAYTCVVVAHAIVRSGNIPVFVDSEVDGFNMDLDLAEAAITEKTGALIATSIHGYPVDLDRLASLQDKHPQLRIIQDCAHSFAASWNGQAVQKAGDAAIFGLNVSKLMTSIFGGMVTTDDQALADSLQQMRDSKTTQRWSRNLSRALYFFAATSALNPFVFEFIDRLQRAGTIARFTEYYDEGVIDMPADYLFAMSRAEASVGVVQCDRYPEIIAHRRNIAASYDKLLAEIVEIERPPMVDGATYSHYVIQVDGPPQLTEKMARQGIELGRLIDYCIPDMPAYQRYRRKNDSFKRTQTLNGRVINLPVWVKANTAEIIAQKLKKSL